MNSLVEMKTTTDLKREAQLGAELAVAMTALQAIALAGEAQLLSLAECPGVAAKALETIRSTALPEDWESDFPPGEKIEL